MIHRIYSGALHCMNTLPCEKTNSYNKKQKQLKKKLLDEVEGICSKFVFLKKRRKTEREREKETDRQTDRQRQRERPKEKREISER